MTIIPEAAMKLMAAGWEMRVRVTPGTGQFVAVFEKPVIEAERRKTLMRHGRGFTFEAAVEDAAAKDTEPH